VEVSCTFLHSHVHVGNFWFLYRSSVEEAGLWWYIPSNDKSSSISQILLVLSCHFPLVVWVGGFFKTNKKITI